MFDIIIKTPYLLIENYTMQSNLYLQLVLYACIYWTIYKYIKIMESLMSTNIFQVIN